MKLFLLFVAVLMLKNQLVTGQCEAGSEDWDYDAAASTLRIKPGCPPINYYECNNWGSYTASNGCPMCCCPRIDADCLKYGNYFDQNRCRHCCHPHSIRLCQMFGFYKNKLGCKVCCPRYDMLQCQQFGWYLDSNGCTVCCTRSTAASTCSKAALPAVGSAD